MQPLGNKIDSLLSLDRQLNLIKYSNAAVKGGYIFEAGVYAGGSLEILAQYNPGVNILAVDSFQGVAKESEWDTGHKEGDFNGVDFHAIAGYFKMVYPAVRIFKGWIPQIFDVFDEHTHFSFSHIDLDMYDAVRHACDFVFPRTLSGGIILFDDYKVRSTAGATKAIEEFFAERECVFKGELFQHPGGPSHFQYLIVK